MYKGSPTASLSFSLVFLLFSQHTVTKGQISESAGSTSIQLENKTLFFSCRNPTIASVIFMKLPIPHGVWKEKHFCMLLLRREEESSCVDTGLLKRPCALLSHSFLSFTFFWFIFFLFFYSFFLTSQSYMYLDCHKNEHWMW